MAPVEAIDGFMERTELESLALIIDTRYEPIRILGSGANGQVILVRDRELEHSLIAIKLLYPHLVFKESSFARFRTETKLTMQLSHPNILPAYGLSRTRDGTIYLKLAFNDGPTLAQVLEANECGLALDWAIRIIGEIASGMEHAHRRGVIHRDLKPANILLDASGAARISDFGVAQVIRAETSFTRYGDIIGTPQYMAPEVMNSQPADPRADIYSFGVIAFEILTGQAPYRANTFWELAEQVCEGRAPVILELRPDVPEALASLIQRCLRVNKAERVSSFSEILAEYPFPLRGESASEMPQRMSAELHSAVTDEPVGFNRIVRRRMQQHFERLLSAAIWSSLILLLLLPPQLNPDASHKYATAVVYLERQVGRPLESLRLLAAMPIDMVWPEVAWSYQPMGAFYSTTFVAAGYPTGIKTADGGTPLHGSVRTVNLGLSKRLLEAGADPNAQMPDGSTPLLLAILGNDSATAERLLKYGASPNISRRDGLTPLMLAASRGRVELVSKLLQAAADATRIDQKGSSALHYAIRAGSAEVVSLLSDAGSSPTLLNNANESPASLIEQLKDPILRQELNSALRRDATHPNL